MGNVEVAYKRLEYSHVVKSVVCREHELSLNWLSEKRLIEKKCLSTCTTRSPCFPSLSWFTAMTSLCKKRLLT